MNGRKLTISVLIVTYNNAHTITGCLRALEAQTFRDFEVLVMDNASRDRTLECLADFRYVRVIKSQKNTGFGAAMNALSAQAQGEYLFMLNPDCLCGPGVLAGLLDFAKTHQGAIAPALYYPDGKYQPSARDFPSYSNVIFSRRSPFYQLGIVSPERGGYLILNKSAPVPAVSATALFISRDSFMRAGGFDERFFMYLEDIDFCRTLTRMKIDIWYVPDVRVTHILGASSKAASLKARYHHHLSMYKYFTKHFPRQYIKNAMLSVFLVAGFGVTTLLRVFTPKGRQ